MITQFSIIIHHPDPLSDGDLEAIESAARTAANNKTKNVQSAAMTYSGRDRKQNQNGE